MLKLSRRQIDHEDVVAQAYAALRRAALYLARGAEAEAGDLLHDTFVRFLLLRPRLDTIANLDGYLYTMLRNVYLSRQRRHVRRKAVVTDAVDVDLLAAMVDEPEPGERLRMRDDLMRLVDHACERTRVSRAASVWILRCVHGYYPAEIARLMKMPSRAVDRALHVARREALEELRKPAGRRRAGGGSGGGQRWRDLHVSANIGVNANVGASAGVGGGTGSGVGGGGANADADETVDTLQALRARLFAAVDGACLTDRDLAELYRPSSGPDSDDPAGTLLMAHVVACAGCLDRINHHLDLPPLKTRDPVESSGTRRRRGDESGGPGGSGGSGGSGWPGGQAEAAPSDRGSERTDGSASRGGGIRSGSTAAGGGAAGKGAAAGGGAGLEPLLRRTRDTVSSIVNHVPRELRIAANGLELGALPVAGVVTVQELAVRLAESLAFVEIFDERGALVCYWPAQVPHGGVLDDDITIELPDGRLIELRVSLMEDCPRLRVRYTDERLGAAAGIGAGAGAGAAAIIGIGNGIGVGDAEERDVREAREAREAREVRDAREARGAPPARAAGLFADEPRRLRWWQSLVPSPRVAILAGALVMLWMILIGPATTWAALGELGRATVAVIRTLFTSRPPVTPPAITTPAPAPPAAAPSTIASPRAGAPARVFSPAELSDLEMAVRIALHDVHADLGEDITLRATPAGVAVHGVVGGVQRRDSIARALAGLDGARMNVRTADEVSKQARASGGRAARSASASPSPSPVRFGDSASPAALAEAGAGESPSSPSPAPAFANPIQKALAERMPAPADRAAFVNETLARADEALARAWALRRLADRYQPRDVTGLSRRSSESLAQLVGDHRAALRTAVDALITRVTPLVETAETIDDEGAGLRRTPTAAAAAAATAAGAGADASPEQRLSVMEMFTLINAWHEDAHALLAGARSSTTSAASADHPDALRPASREWLIRLHHIQNALQQLHVIPK